MNRSFIRTRAAKRRHFPELTIWLIFALRTSKWSFKKRMFCCNGENLSFLFSTSSLCLLLLLTFDYLGFFSATHLLIIAFFRFSISCFNVFSAAFSLLQVHMTRNSSFFNYQTAFTVFYYHLIKSHGKWTNEKIEEYLKWEERKIFLHTPTSKLWSHKKKSKISLGLLHLVL